MSPTESWLLWLLAPYVLGVFVAGFGSRTVRLSHCLASVGGLVGASIALASLLSGEATARLSYPLAGIGNVAFRLDPSSAWFLLIISAIGALVALYAVSYVEPGRAGSARLALGFHAFLATMELVVVADSALAFLMAWEAMSLVSFLLVVHDHHSREVRRAGYIYLVMTQAGTAFIVVAFLLLGVAAGGLDFGDFRAAATELSPLCRDLIFLCALIGFGTKAGLIPFHIWLPRAHPAAPSHVSALMSGVMLKTAIYALLRVGWEFVGVGPAWWGGLLLAAGAVSAVLGVLYALVDRDLKRVLAFSSVENIGLIVMGVGAGLVLRALGEPGLAAFALAAALIHALNHAVFKSLLFLGAGAVQHATHTRQLDLLGGLIHRLPATAAACFVGAAAISALPPLNGFVGEWLLLQALMQLGHAAGGSVGAIGAAVAIGAFALTSGLAALCFVRMFCVAFLGMPRSAQAAAAREVASSERAAMALLAGLCVVLGVMPAWLLRALGLVVAPLAGAGLPAVRGTAFAPALTAPIGGAGWNPLGLTSALLVAGLLGLGLARLLGGPGRSRVAPTWACGVSLEPAMQYSGAALAKPIRLIFAALVRPIRTPVPERVVRGVGPAVVTFRAGVEPVYERHLYRHAVGLLLGVSTAVRRIQSGSLRLYLVYLFAALVVALLLTR